MTSTDRISGIPEADVTNPVSITSGGTGSTTAAAARTALGVDATGINLPLAGGTLTGGLNEARGSVAMHATTMALWAQPNIIDGTSTAVTITAIANAPQAGARRVLYPVAASVITNGATFAVDGAADATAAAGDAWEFEAITTSTYKVHVTKKDGTAVVDTGGVKNAIINGGFTINRRVYVSAATLATTVYGHDRWKAGASGGDYSFTQLNSNTQITIAANKTLIQVVEDKNVASTSYALSWEGTALARYAVNSATPAGAYAASPILITGQTAGTTMSIEFGNGASAGTLGKVQLEAGSAATPFEQRPYGLELSLCQRYLPGFAFGAQRIGTGQAVTTNQVILPLPFKVKARTAPTGITASAASNFSLADATQAYGTNQTGTAIAFTDAGEDVGTVLITCTSGLVAGNASVALSRFSGVSILFTGCEL